ncbi:hypothetical protein CRUP_022919, partial [Coryphaenoides rupestris]
MKCTPFAGNHVRRADTLEEKRVVHSTLKHMNALRTRQHFCDVTIVASDNQTFRGHKVVLAACSPFLRDQFLLNPASKLQ